MSPDLYAVLQVGRRATRTEIKASYRRLVARLHVDRFGGGGGPALERHQLLNLARDTLTDPELRARYDARPVEAPPRAAPPRAARAASTVRAAPPRWAWTALYGLMLMVLAAALDGRRKPRQRWRA